MPVEKFASVVAQSFSEKPRVPDPAVKSSAAPAAADAALQQNMSSGETKVNSLAV